MTHSRRVYRFVYPGHPQVLKNSRKLITVKGRGGKPRPLFVPSAKAKKALGAATEILGAQALQQGLRSPIASMVNLSVTFYCACSEGQLPDLSNLYELPQDALEAAGVLKNDRLVAGHDGSRRVACCDVCDRRAKGRKTCALARTAHCPEGRTVLELTVKEDHDGR